MFKNLFKKSYTSINTNDHGSAGVSRAESAKADKRAAEAAQEKPEKIPSRPTAMTPESLRSLWRKCNKCEKPILVQDVKDNLYVCPRCGGYFRMHAYRRIEMLIDEGTFEEWDKEMSVVNPLAFPGYEGKVEAAREKTELNEAVVTGKGKIHGYETVIAVCDSRFLMSSMGHNMGEKIARAVERATEERLPVIIYAASGGARMQEGMISLMQMAKTSAALKRHSEAGLLYISFMTDPTTGGVTASFASLGDIILAEPGALIGFAGPRVIEQTIGQKLPMPGDAEAPYLRALLRSGADLSADVLVLPHHGSAGSLVPALYDAVSPKLAIASAGAYNPYRLPSRKVRDALEWRDIPLHITGNEGEIAVHWDLKKNAGKKNILQEGFPPPRPHLSQYVQPMGRARESSPAGNTK